MKVFGEEVEFADCEMDPEHQTGRSGIRNLPSLFRLLFHLLYPLISPSPDVTPHLC